MNKLYAAALTLFLLPATALADGMLAQINRHGGLCGEGECNYTVSVSQSGVITVQGMATPAVAPEPDKLPEDELAVFKQRIESANYDSIRADKFTGTCPTASDGQEIVYIVSTTSGRIKLPSCSYSIDADAEPFRTLNVIYNEQITKAR